MKKYLSYNHFICLLILYVVAVIILGCDLKIFNDDYSLVVGGKTVNLNEYIKNQSTDDFKFLKDTDVTLSVNKCYGRFYQLDHRKTHYGSYHEFFYVIWLEDDSVMVAYSQGDFVDELDDMSICTKYLRDSDSLIFHSKLSGLNGEVKQRFDEYVKNLKNDGILASDVEVRYFSVSDRGGRDWAVYDIAILFIIDLTIFIAGIVYYNKNAICVYNEDEYCVLDNKNRYSIVYIYEYIVVAFLIICCYILFEWNIPGINSYFMIVILAILALVVPWMFLKVDKKN